MAIEASKLFELDFNGIDIMFGDNNKPILCELNSNPQFKSTFDATEIDLGGIYHSKNM